jgi:hypothetical protein
MCVNWNLPSSSSSCSGRIRFDSCSLYPQNEIGPSISSLVVLCYFVLLVHIVTLVLVFSLCPSSVRVVATSPGTVLFPNWNFPPTGKNGRLPKCHITQLPGTQKGSLVLYHIQGHRTVESHSSTSSFNGLFFFLASFLCVVRDTRTTVCYCTAAAQTTKPTSQLTAR